MLVPIRKLGATGVITPDDYPSEEAPPNAMTDASSVMFRGGYVRKAAGWQPEIIDFVEDQQWMQGWDNGSQVSIAFASADRISTTTDGQTTQEAVLLGQGSEVITLSQTENWQSDVFGKFCIMNNGIDTPLYSVGYDGGNDVWTFQQIPGWGMPNSPQGPVEVIMEFREHLIAIGVSDNPFTVYCSSTPESAAAVSSGTLRSGIGLFASGEMGQAYDIKYSQLVSTVPFTSLINVQQFPQATLAARTSFTSEIQLAVQPSARVVATVPFTSIGQMQCVSPYVQNRIANNSIPATGYLHHQSTLWTDDWAEFTLSTWVRFDTSGARHIISGRNYNVVTPTNAWMRLYRSTAGRLSFAILDDAGNGIGSFSAGADFGPVIGTVTTGWHHVLIKVSFTLNRWNAWVDGVEEVHAAAFTLPRVGGPPFPMASLNRWAVFANPANSASSYTAMSGAVADLYITDDATPVIGDLYNSPTVHIDPGFNGSLLPYPARLFFGGDMTPTTGGVNGLGWTGVSGTLQVTPWGAYTTAFVRPGTSVFTATT